jgi:hypothetical protein
MLKSIVKIEDYLTELDKIKEDVNIYITVGDIFCHTQKIKDDKNYQDYIKNISDTFRKWGFDFSCDTDISVCFAGVLEAGGVKFDGTSKKSVIYECEHHGLKLKLISNAFVYNGDMHIYVNGVDYAYYTTGVAFLILDRNSNEIIDAATFDTFQVSDAKRFSFADQMALYEKCNTEGLIDKYLSKTLIYVDGENIPLFYDFLNNNNRVNRELLFSDKDRTVGDLKFRLMLLKKPIVLTTHPKIIYKEIKNPNLIRPRYLINSLLGCAESSEILKKIYEKCNLADKNRIGILFAHNTGDAYYTLAISKVYEKESGKKPVLIFRERVREIFNLFSAYDIEHIFLPQHEYDALYETNTITGGAFCLKYNILDYFHTGEYWRVIPEMGWYKGICSCLRIPYDESNKRLFIRPENQTCDREMYIERDGIVPGKTVLLSPESYSDPMIPYSFWNTLQGVLEEKGFKCLVMAYNKSTLKNMKGPFVKIPYCDAIDYVQLCGCVIAKRSGFVDVISAANVSLTTMYCHEVNTGRYNLNEMGLRRESDGYYNNIYVDEKRMNEDDYAAGILESVLKFTEE